MRVKDCMCNNVVRATSETTLEKVAKLMQENDVGCVPICNQENNVIGFITDRDIITRCIANGKNCAQTKASDIMTTKVIKTTPDTQIDDATQTMSKNQIRRVPVVNEQNKIVGILTMGDLAHHGQTIGNKEFTDTLENICDCKGSIKNCC